MALYWQIGGCERAGCGGWVMDGAGGGDVSVEVAMVVNIFALFLILMGVFPKFSCDVCCSFLVNVFSSS